MPITAGGVDRRSRGDADFSPKSRGKVSAVPREASRELGQMTRADKKGRAAECRGLSVRPSEKSQEPATPRYRCRDRSNGSPRAAYGAGARARKERSCRPDSRPHARVEAHQPLTAQAFHAATPRSGARTELPSMAARHPGAEATGEASPRLPNR